jgi:hypothetical protein
LLAPGHGLPYNRFFTFKNSLNPSIPQISHPAGQSQFLRLVLGVPAKADSLDTSRDMNMGPNMLPVDLIGHNSPVDEFMVSSLSILPRSVTPVNQVSTSFRRGWRSKNPSPLDLACKQSPWGVPLDLPVEMTYAGLSMGPMRSAELYFLEC